MQATSKRAGALLRNRWAALPGVTYTQAGRYEREDEDTLLRRGYVPTSEVAESMDRSDQTARRLLRRAGARPIQGEVSNELYWPPAVAEKAIAAVRDLPREQAPGPGELKSAAVCRILGVSRSTLHRYTARGLLHPRVVMLPCGKAHRIALLYDEVEVQTAADRLNAQDALQEPQAPRKGKMCHK